MKKYIKINTNNEIIDVFFKHQVNKFDGSEIFLEEVETLQHKINGKSISDEFGNPIFKYENEEIIEYENIDFLKNLKNKKKSKVRQEFANYEAEGVDEGIYCESLDIYIQCGKKDIEKIEAVITRAGMERPVPNYFIGETEMITGVDLEDFKAAYLTMTDKYNEMFETKHTKYQAIKDATTKEEVEAI